MIPKVIHVCWFGGKEMPPDILKCKESWYNILPDYEIKIWDENSWDINQYPYAKQAYDMGKFAFVSDVCRVDILSKFGGISIDADVEILKPFDAFLHFSGFTCKESSGRWISAVFGSVANHIWMKTVLKYYEENEFVFNPSKYTNTVIIDNINHKLYDRVSGDVIFLYGNVAIFQRDFFEAKDWGTGEIQITENTHSVHNYNGSWLR